jgi:hypothetical protein
MSDDLIKTPCEDIGNPPKDNRGGPGVYDGEPGLQKRTPSPNAVPEKIYDKIPGGEEADKSIIYQGQQK